MYTALKCSLELHGANRCHHTDLDAAGGDCTVPALLTAAAADAVVATWTVDVASLVLSADVTWPVGGGLPDNDTDGSSGSADTSLWW